MENDLKYIVYCTVNQVNDKIYIGVHKTDITKFDGYIGCGVYINRPATYERSKTVFQLAVKKYGIKSFKRYTIATFDNEDEAYLMEQSIVNKDFLKRTDVYNTALGGSNGAYLLTCRKVYQYTIDGTFLREYSSVKEAAVSVNRHSTSIERAIEFKSKCSNYFWTDIKYDKLDLSKMKQYVGQHTIPVYQYSSTGEYECCYESIEKCAEALNINSSNISTAIKLASKYNNKYFSTVFKETFIKANNKRIQTTEIHQYDLDGNYIASYSGQPEAKKKLNIKSDIYKAIRLHRTAGNFQWSFEKLPQIAPYKAKTGRKRRVGKYTKDWKLIKEYESKSEAMLENGKGLAHVLDGRDEFHKGFRYKFLS